MIGGAGVGLTMGTLPAAATASLPARRFATGVAVFGMARQLGSAIGVAVLVALIDSAGGDLLHGIEGGWWFALGAGLGAAALAFSLPARAKAPAAEPSAAAACSSFQRSSSTTRAGVGLGQLAGAAPAPHLVLRLEHLAHVVDLILDLDLRRAGREPVDQLGVVARVEMADQHQNADDEQENRDRPQQQQHRLQHTPAGVTGHRRPQALR